MIRIRPAHPPPEPEKEKPRIVATTAALAKHFSSDLTTSENLSAEINAEHELAYRKAGEAVKHAQRAGVLLIEAKAALEHGQWLPWVKANCKFSEKTATGYMRLSQLDPANQQRVADLSLRKALTEIAAPAQTTKAPKVDQAHQDDVVEVDPVRRQTDRGVQVQVYAALKNVWTEADADTRRKFLLDCCCSEPMKGLKPTEAVKIGRLFELHRRDEARGARGRAMTADAAPTAIALPVAPH